MKARRFKGAGLGMLRMRFIHSMQYRAAAWAGVSTQIFWGVMNILLYRAFYQEHAEAFTMTFPQVTSYVWLRQAFFSMFILWSVDQDILDMILNGNVAYELIRPVDLYRLWFARNLGTRLSRVILRCIPIFAIGFLLPSPYGLALPPDLPSLIGFLCSFVIAVGLLIGMCMWIYITSFYTVASRGIQNIVGAISDLLAGSLIPIPFMPEKMQKVLNLLPFASTQNTPYLIYSGYFHGAEAWLRIALQLFWLILIVGTGHAMMKKALRRVVIQGG